MTKGILLKKIEGLPRLFMAFVLFLTILLDGYNFLKVLYIPPFLSLSVLYYWCVHAKLDPSYILVIMAGLLLDLVGGAYLGQNAIIFVLVQYVVCAKKSFLQISFLREWIGLLGAITGASIIENSILYCIHQTTLQLWEVLYGQAITFIFYPCLHKLLRFVWLQR